LAIPKKILFEEGDLNMKRLILILFILLILFFTTGVDLYSQSKPNPEIDKYEDKVKTILDAVSPSIIKVVAENHKKYVASGIAVDPSHVISTTYLIQFPHDSIYIETVKGERFPARIVGKDMESSILLLEVDQTSLIPIKKANSYNVGDWIALVGVFYNKFPAIYQGIVSSGTNEDIILNAPVVPGASGGAVINKKGEMVGIIRGRFGFSSIPDYIFRDHSSEISIQSYRNPEHNLCYAVPLSKVTRILGDLKKYGMVKRGWLGVLLDQDEDGVSISFITKNSPADKAGLLNDDRITLINGKTIRSAEDVASIIKSTKPNQKVTIEIMRGKIKKSLPVLIEEMRMEKLAASPPNMEFFNSEFPEIAGSLPRLENYVFRISNPRSLGIDVMLISPELAKEFNIKEGTGLMISKVFPGSSADKAGLRPSDVIVKAQNKPINDNSDLRNILNELEEKEPLTVEYYRKGQLKRVSLVPDPNRSFEDAFTQFKEKMEQVRKRIDVQRKEMESRGSKEEKSEKDREKLRQIEMLKYKNEIEKMKKNQLKLIKEMEKLKKLLEEEKKQKSKDGKE